MKFFYLLICSIFFISCITTFDTKIDDNITVDKLFFKAQVLQNKIATKSDSLAVINLYKEILKRFPDLKSIGIEAKYEIGIIYYKMKDYKNAENYFYEILKDYQKENLKDVPEWAPTLSEYMIKKIDEKTDKKDIKEISQ